MEDENILVLFYMKRNSFYNSEENEITPANYSMKFYESDDDDIGEINEKIKSSDYESIQGEFFFKGIYLKGIYSAFIYSIYNIFINDFEVIMEISMLHYETDDNLEGIYYFITTVKTKLEQSYDINIDLITNEFIKLNEERLVFITTKEMIDSKP